MNANQSIAAFAVLSSAILGTSCASLSQEQITKNEQSRLEQQSQGYFDRESSAQQKKADERSEQERLHDKK